MIALPQELRLACKTIYRTGLRDVCTILHKDLQILEDKMQQDLAS